MKLNKLQNLFVIILVVLVGFASFFGIYTKDNSSSYYFKSIRGQEVLIYGKGLYKHMSADVAVQGIAQDYITLFVAIPLLLFSLILMNKGHRLWKYVFTSIIGYFFITYLMYLNMAMYNSFFLVYVVILGFSFFFLINCLVNDSNQTLGIYENSNHIFKNAGKFLMINASLVGFLWLSVVVPPLINGTIIPLSVAHYTTLTVQGLDLSLFLPLSFIAGYLAWKNKPCGYYFTIIYSVFLTILMTALSSKIVFMAHEGVSVVPAIFIIPTITLTALYFSVKMLKSLKK